MKSFIAALALCITGFTAHAANPNLPVAAPEFYTGKNLDIAVESVLLPQADQITRATVMIDKEARVIRLVIERPWSCPEGMLCAAVMPEPIIIELPITYMGVPFGGGRVIVAEDNKLPVDGMLQRLEIVDQNGSIAEGTDPGFVPMQVTLIEVLPRTPNVHFVSTMDAVTFLR